MAEITSDDEAALLILADEVDPHFVRAPLLCVPGWNGQDVFVSRAGDFYLERRAPASGRPYRVRDARLNPTPTYLSSTFIPKVLKTDVAKLVCHGFAVLPERWTSRKFEAVLEKNGPRWVPKSETNAQRSRPGGPNPGGKRKLDPDEPQASLEGEVFRPLANLDAPHEHANGAFAVSNLGRARIDGVYARGNPIAGGYLAWNKTFRGRKVGIQAHVAVCATFCGARPSPKHTVDHLNRDRTDNRLTNLRWANEMEQQFNRSNTVARDPAEQAAYDEHVKRYKAYEKDKAGDKLERTHPEIARRLPPASGLRAQLALYGVDPFAELRALYGAAQLDLVLHAHYALECLAFSDVATATWDRLGVHSALRDVLTAAADVAGAAIDDIARELPRFSPDAFVRTVVGAIVRVGDPAEDGDEVVPALPESLQDSALADGRARLAFDFVCMLLAARRA